MHAVAPTTTPYAQALARLPAGALPAPLAAFWRDRAEAGAPMRDRADVLLDTLAILSTLNADAEVMAAALLDALVDIEPLAAEAKIEIPERLQVLLEGQRASSRVWALHRDHGGGRNPEGMRRLLLALVRDLRVVPSCWRARCRGCARPPPARRTNNARWRSSPATSTHRWPTGSASGS
jgi:GTP pyrophosphokinase